MEKLKDHDLCFLHKHTIEFTDICKALSLPRAQILPLRTVAVDDQWLCSIRSYSELLFQGWFYRLFKEWDYLLIVQQDAWVFGDGDELSEWIRKGYTYIGAPWTAQLGPDTPDMGVGNGGFSLRHVASMICICDSLKALYMPVFRFRKLAHRMALLRRYHLFPTSQWPLIFSKRLAAFIAMSFGWHNTLAYFSRTVGTQEDHLISLFAPQVFPWIRIPSMEEAAAFSVEANPRETCAYYNVARPFGCHAWEKHNRSFWVHAYPEEFHSVPAEVVSLAASPSPLITVVMATLDAAIHLQRSLGSLAQQTSRNFEIVIVDGGSSDGTCRQASLILEDANIVYRMIDLPGSGIYEAINCGILQAKGDWLYVMGADDCLISPEVFSSIIPSLIAAGSSDTLVVHGDVWIEDPGYRYGQPWDLPRFLDRNISHQSAFYRRKAIRELGFVYDPKYSLYADWDYNIRLFASGAFYYVPLLIASYACAGASSRKVDETFLAEKECNAYRYLGLRSLWLMPPHRFAMAGGSFPGMKFRLQLLLNRSLWALKRLSPAR